MERQGCRDTRLYLFEFFILIGVAAGSVFCISRGYLFFVLAAGV